MRRSSCLLTCPAQLSAADTKAATAMRNVGRPSRFVCQAVQSGASVLAGGPSPISENSFTAAGRSGSFCFWGLMFEPHLSKSSKSSSVPWRTCSGDTVLPCAAQVVCVMLNCDAEVWQATGTGTNWTLQWSGP